MSANSKMTAQSVYDQYVASFGYSPKTVNHLIAFSKKQGTPIPYSKARAVLNSNKQTDNEMPLKVSSKTTPQSTPSKPSELQTESKSESMVSDLNESEGAPPNVEEHEIELIDEEKTDQKEAPNLDSSATAQPIFCRVNFECSSETAKQEIYDALRLFVDLQLKAPNPGVMMYHFTCPQPTKYPLKLEFIELYHDEMVYWNHAKSPSFYKAFVKGFKNENRKSRAFITVGSALSEMVKRTNAGFDSTFPESEAGYLLHDEYLKILDLADDMKLLLKLEMMAPNYYRGHKQNVGVIQKIMDKLSVFAKESNAIMFHCHRVLEKVYPDRIEVVSVWPNGQCLMEFLENENVKEIASELNELMGDDNGNGGVETQVYGKLQVAVGILEALKNIFVGSHNRFATDIGYILHPKANSKHLH